MFAEVGVTVVLFVCCMFEGYEVVIVKGGQRVCGSGGALGNAPLVQSKSYFEVKIQQGGSWAIGLATRQTNLSLTQGKYIVLNCLYVMITLFFRWYG